jgi:hypothetical protein
MLLMQGTKQKTTNTWAMEQRWRGMAAAATVMTPAQLATAYEVCAEHGESFGGIRDRADAVAGRCSTARDVAELLTAIHPQVAARIMGWQ